MTMTEPSTRKASSPRLDSKVPEGDISTLWENH